MKEKIDVIVVGQGLAGTLLTYFLWKKGKSVVVIDPAHRDASSAIAAGIINPITGYRFVKSWLLDEILPVAESTYHELADLLGQSFYQPRDILRILFSAGEENDWLARTAQDGWRKYVEEEADWGHFAGVAEEGFSKGLLRGAQLDAPALIKAFQQWLAQNQMWRNETLDYDALQFSNGGVQYKDISASLLVFL